METIKLNNLRKVREAGSNESLIPIKEFKAVKNVIAYGILRKWHEAQKTACKINGIEVWDLYGSYPHAFLNEESFATVSKLINLSEERKSRIDSMETYAGYDTYEFDHKNKKFHIYIARDSFKSSCFEHERRDWGHKIQAIPNGDFLKHRENAEKEIWKRMNKRRKESGQTRILWSQYKKW